MHHSQLEYLVAVQKLQRQDRGAKGYGSRRVSERVACVCGKAQCLCRIAGIYPTGQGAYNTADAARRTSDGRVPYGSTLDGKVSVFLRSGRRRCKRRRRKMRMRAYGLDAAGTRQSAYRAKRIKIFLHIGSHMGTHVRATGIQTTLKEKKENARCC